MLCTILTNLFSNYLRQSQRHRITVYIPEIVVSSGAQLGGFFFFLFVLCHVCVQLCVVDLKFL